ncbi:DPY30 domain-containing protein 2 isoform X2 [Anolis carolinensis]|uniref:DPY30 domain-containing protein 2 isoform X2 n=1 Tax=Anolis carolinensis TaxID=28377 RepID=UPI002F2B6556
MPSLDWLTLVCSFPSLCSSFPGTPQIADWGGIDLPLNPSQYAQLEQSILYRMETDVEYLKKCMGKCLAAGLAEVADRQPEDPIIFLAHWLYNYNERRNYEEKMKVERAQLEREYEDAIKELERRRKLKAEEILVAQKYEEQQMKCKEKDVNIPKEYETGASKDTLKEKQNQNDLNMLKNVLNEIPGEVATNVTLQEALPEITVDEDFDHVTMDMDDREKNQLEYYKIMENEDDIPSENHSSDEEYRSSSDLN